MKTTFIFLLFGFSVFGQMYHRTGRNIGFTLEAHGATSNKDLTSMAYGGSAGLTHMFHPGIFLNAGYSYAKMYTNSGHRIVPNMPSTIQTIDASILADKRFLILSNGRAVKTAHGCHYFSFGFIVAPEYHYHLNINEPQNVIKHEMTFLTGLSFCHMFKNRGRVTMANTTQYDVFYRHGITPFYQAKGSDASLKRMELGIRICRIKHQVANSIR
jgi:hypothetical protein